MGIVFINYRRDETAGEARALYNDLVELLGAERVFMDVDNIALGRDFRQVLRERLDACEVMLSLIGRDWAQARDSAGARRLDNPADFVRLEIATALQRNVAVTPVLLQDAHMPSAESLPDELKDLAYRNGFELSHTRWESDVHELVRRLGLAPAATPTPVAAPPAVSASPPAAVAANLTVARKSTPIAIGALGLLMAAALVGWMATRGDRPAQPVTPVQETTTIPVPSPAASSSETQAAAAPEPAQAEIETLLLRLNDDSEAARRTAAERLRRDGARSRLAVGLAVNQLSAANFQGLSKEGRVELLGFLLATDDTAWTPDRRAAAADAVHRIQQRVASGSAHLVPQVLDLLDQLGRRVGA